MKKYRFGIAGVSIFVATIALYALLKRPASRSSKVEMISKDKTNTLMVERRIEVKGKAKVDVRKFASKEDAKKAVVSPLDSFRKTEVGFFSEQILLVEGAFASVEQHPGQGMITRVGGFSVYLEKNEKSLEVVFDNSKMKYGVFTGEISVKGNYAEALMILTSSSFDIVYKNELIQEIIFKVDSMQDVSSLASLRSLSGVQIRPDIKFSRLTAR
jgi:hypothetical protein